MADFVWGAGGNKLSPVDRRRRMAEAMLKSGADYSPVQHWAQGLARLSQALIGGMYMRDADAADKAGAEDVSSKFAALTGALGGGAAAPSTGGAAPSFAGGGSSRTMAMPVTDEVKQGIIGTAKALGVTPQDVATAISYETGGTFNPTQVGPTTKWGQHRGYIQFGEPQAKQFGVDWNNPIGSQLGENGAIVKYALANGFKPGMSFMDLYSTINAGAPGRYGARDAAAGGAPGTVADKVNSQMGGHRARARALFPDVAQADMPAPDAMPAEAATGQPGFAVPPGPQPAMTGATFNAITAGQPLEPAFQAEGVSQPWMGTALQPAQPAGPQMVQAPLPPPRPAMADMPAPDAVPAIGQLPPQAPPMLDLNSSDAGSRTFAVTNGGTQPVPTGAAPSGGVWSSLAAALGGGSAPPAAAPAASPAVQRIAQAIAPTASAAPTAGADRTALAMSILNSPYAQPGQRAVAQMIVQQAFKDPAETEMKRLQLDKARREAEAAPLELEGRRLDIEGKKKSLGKTEAPNVQRIKQPDGSEVAVQWDQGTGTWVPLVAPGGGNAVKAPTKLTEQQSKDLVYHNRGIQALEEFEKDAGAYASGMERFASGVPGGNYVVTEQFQKAQQAGRNFLASILRKDTGAAITKQEEEQYGSIFLPQPGDKPGVLEQKRAARLQAIEAIKGGLGTAEVMARASEALKAPAQRPTGKTKSGVSWSVE